MTSGRMVKGKTLDAELVVIGGGGAGLAAALEAAERGATRVIVVEKRGNLGGNSALASGLFACESPVQARQSIISDKDELLKRAVEWAHWSRVDPRILRAFINKSGETIRWLEDKGLEFDLIRLYPDQQPPVQHNPRGKGARLIKILAQECRDLGVQFLMKTSSKRIIRDKQGNVTGVIIVKEGDETKITAGGIIIATGGFAGNPELLNRYCPSYDDGMVLSGLPLKGDGLYLAAEAGAAIENFVTVLKEGPRFDLRKWPVMHFERDPATLWVNKKGERFIDETIGYHVFESVNAMLRQPDKISYALLDATLRRQFEGKMPDLEKALQAEVKKDRVKISDSWDDIAAWIGADPGVLKATVAKYNSFCRQEYDGDYAKERRYLLPLTSPPYYAIKGLSVILDTIGGIRINEHMQVLDNQNNPVPGLYAAGVVTSGWESEIYCSNLSASAFGFAINSGRIAGEEALQFASAAQ